MLVQKLNLSKAIITTINIAAIKIDPTSEIAFIHRASYYCLIGDLNMAVENYNQAINLTKSVPFLTEYLIFRLMCTVDIAIQEKVKKIIVSFIYYFEHPRFINLKSLWIFFSFKNFSFLDLNCFSLR